MHYAGMPFRLVYPFTPGAPIARLELPEKAAGPSSFLYELDLTDWLGILGGTEVTAADILADPTLTISQVSHHATGVTFLLKDGVASMALPMVQVAIYLSDQSRLDVSLAQPIVDLGSFPPFVGAMPAPPANAATDAGGPLIDASGYLLAA